MAKYTVFDTTTVKFKQVTATTVSLGVGNAGDIPALGSNGKLDSSMIDSAAGGSVHAMVCTENLSAGDWVHIYNNAGTRACRKALATDATKPACGYVKESATAGTVASVYVSGTNEKIPVAGFSMADLSLRAFLSATTVGGTVKVVSSFTTGNLIQSLGTIVGVDSTYVYVEVAFGEQIVC